jgi:NAD(P)H-nitrite reductase large subunit
MRRYVIIGSGPAGIAAAQAIRRQDSAASIVIFGDEKAGYYSRPGLAYCLTGEVNESQIFPLKDSELNELNIQLVHNRVTRLHLQGHRLEVSTGAVVQYDRLLIATGSLSAREQVPGHHAQGVVKLDNLEDLHEFIEYASRARTAVVVGGGITALEIVEGLVVRGVRVHYLLRGERYWASILDQVESSIIEQRLENEGVKLHFHTEISEILQDHGKVTAVRTRDGATIKCDMVAVAIGVLPNKDLAEACGIQTKRGILADEYLRTSAADVFTAGDVAQVFDPLTKSSVQESLWGPAREQGEKAGLNMSGLKEPYRRRIPVNVTRLTNLTTSIIGSVGHGQENDLISISRGESEIWRQEPESSIAQTRQDVNRLRLLLGSKTLLGAVVMGDQELSLPLQHLIQNKIDISSIRGQLIQPGAPLSETLLGFWAKQQGKIRGAS